jgi:transcriptional regulator GlxA family with amidase domain
MSDPNNEAETSGRSETKLRFGFLLLPRFTLSAFSTFLDPLRLAGDIGDRSQQERCTWEVMSFDGRAVRSSCGLEVLPTAKLRPAEAFDYLVVAGGVLGSVDERFEPITDYLLKGARAGASIIGLCTGVFPMVEAGLPIGMACCVSWFHVDDFAARFDDVEMDTTSLFLLGERHGTCAGGIGAAHLSLELIRRHLGINLMHKAARILMISEAMMRSSAQPQQRQFGSAQDPKVARALLQLEQNLSEMLDLDSLGERAGLSVRQLQRRFRADLGISISEAQNQLRIQRAKELLSNTDTKIIDIGYECGFAGPSSFSSSFKKQAGVTPSEYRCHNANRGEPG